MIGFDRIRDMSENNYFMVETSEYFQTYFHPRKWSHNDNIG